MLLEAARLRLPPPRKKAARDIRLPPLQGRFCLFVGVVARAGCHMATDEGFEGRGSRPTAPRLRFAWIEHCQRIAAELPRCLAHEAQHALNNTINDHTLPDQAGAVTLRPRRGFGRRLAKLGQLSLSSVSQTLQVPGRCRAAATRGGRGWGIDRPQQQHARACASLRPWEGPTARASSHLARWLSFATLLGGRTATVLPHHSDPPARPWLRMLRERVSHSGERWRGQIPHGAGLAVPVGLLLAWSKEAPPREAWARAVPGQAAIGGLGGPRRPANGRRLERGGPPRGEGRPALGQAPVHMLWGCRRPTP